MSFTLMLKAAIEAENDTGIKAITMAALDYYTEQFLKTVNEMDQDDSVFISAVLRVINEVLDTTLGGSGKEARDALLKTVEIRTVDMRKLMKEGMGE